MATDVGLWGVVEIMGHRTRAGLLSDAQIGGATMLRVQHPTRQDHTGEAQLEELYAASAIFAIRPCSREEAERVAAWAWVPPAAALGPGLAPELAERVDDDDAWVDDEDEF